MRRICLNRNAKVNGYLVAGTLAEIQSQPLKLAYKICTKHKKWRVGRYYRTCCKCGFTEEKP